MLSVIQQYIDLKNLPFKHKVYSVKLDFILIKNNNLFLNRPGQITNWLTWDWMGHIMLNTEEYVKEADPISYYQYRNLNWIKAFNLDHLSTN